MPGIGKCWRVFLNDRSLRPSDGSGLGRLLGPAGAIGKELRRTASARGLRVHVALAPTRTAAMLLALARPGLTVVAPERESLRSSARDSEAVSTRGGGAPRE